MGHWWIPVVLCDAERGRESGRERHEPCRGVRVGGQMRDMRVHPVQVLEVAGDPGRLVLLATAVQDADGCSLFGQRLAALLAGQPRKA